MIRAETDKPPVELNFDVAIVAIGYEKRCRWIAENVRFTAITKVGLEFGFLTAGSYPANRAFFDGQGFTVLPGLQDSTAQLLANAIIGTAAAETKSVFVDISSMSREMIANVILAIQMSRDTQDITVTMAYAPSKFSGDYGPAPIRLASPIKPSLAGWSSQPEKPLGAIFGLGCEPGLALGALQVLEPNKAWLFKPKGVDPKFDAALKTANRDIDEIFDTSTFTYQILEPTATRGRFEGLLNAIDPSFRLIVVPFGPKVFAWLSMASVIFMRRNSIGVWAFSSKESALLVDRDAEGNVVWHSLVLPKVG